MRIWNNGCSVFNRTFLRDTSNKYDNMLMSKQYLAMLITWCSRSYHGWFSVYLVGISKHLFASEYCWTIKAHLNSKLFFFFCGKHIFSRPNRDLHEKLMADFLTEHFLILAGHFPSNFCTSCGANWILMKKIWCLQNIL